MKTMINFFKSLFRCFGPGSAYVVPATETLEDLKCGSKVGRDVRLKRSSEGSKSVDTESDCLLLIGTIKLTHHIAADLTSSDPSKAFTFSFTDINLHTAYRSPLGKTGISAFRMLLGKTILKDVKDVKRDFDTKTLVSLINHFTSNVNLSRGLGDTIPMTPLTVMTTTMSRTLTQEDMIIITDLFFQAIHDYISNDDCKASIEVNAEIYPCFERLCDFSRDLSTALDEHTTVRTMQLICQCTARASKIVCTIGASLSSHLKESGIQVQIAHTSSALQSLAATVLAIKMHSVHDSYSLSMIFWSACESLSGVAEAVMKDNKEDAENLMTSSVKDMLNALRLTIPTPKDLLVEVRRLQSEESDQQESTPSKSSSTSSKSPRKSACPGTRRLQYIIDGLQVILRAGVLESKKGKQSVNEARSEREKWMQYIAESLFFVLDHSLPVGAPATPPATELKTAGTFCCVTSLAPALAGMFLDVLLSHNSNGPEDLHRIQWTFWELAKRLAAFAERLRRGRRSMAIYSKKVSRQSSHHLLAPAPHSGTGTGSAVRGVDGLKKGTHEALRLQLQLSGIRQQEVAFLLEDTVDGMCVLPNGTQRWYPGRITAVNADGTYTVKFMDGDVHENKTACEIRHTKNSKLSSARSNRNMHSSRDSHILSQSNQGTAREVVVESSPKPSVMGFSSAYIGIISNPASARNLGPESSGIISFTNSPDTPGVDGPGQSNYLSNGDARPSLFRLPSSRSTIGTPHLTGLMEKTPSRTQSKDNAMVKSQGMGIGSITYEGGVAAQRTLTALLSASSMKKHYTDSSVTILKSTDIEIDQNEGINIPGCTMPSAYFKQQELANDQEVVSRRAPFLGQRPSHRKSWKSEDSRCSGDSYESDGQTFAIPSVFPTPRTERKADVPRMHLNNLTIGCSPAVGTGMSLSAAICREGSLNRDDNDCDDSDGDHSYAEMDDSTAISTSTNTNCPTPTDTGDVPTSEMVCRELSIHCLDASDDVDSCKMLTWRGHSMAMGQQAVSEPVKPLDIDAALNRIDLNSCSNGVVTTTDAVTRQESMALVSATCSTSSKYIRSLKSTSYSSFRGDDSVRGMGDVKGNARSCYLSGTGYDEQTLAVLMRTYTIISASLLQRCVVGEGNFLDIGTCSTHETDSSSSLLAKRRYSDWGTDEAVSSPASTSLKSQSLVGQLVLPDDVKPLTRTKAQKKQINILFSIREYLESIPDSEQYHITPILTEISNFSLGASMRILKLISPYMLHSCLPSHMSEAEKVGAGGFGSVFKVCCDATCKDHRNTISAHTTLCQSLSQSQLVHNSKRNSGRRSLLMGTMSSTAKSTNSISIRNDNGSTPSRTIYAVKRIPRERSVYDSPIIYDIFSEITCLEFLAGNKGVCQLLDFGVHGVEYWMVMEAGKMDLLAWRIRAPPKGKAAPSSRSPYKDWMSFEDSNPMKVAGRDSNGDSWTDPGSPSRRGVTPDIVDERQPLTPYKLAVCLALYADALLIVQSVHSARVLHFDIKCNNFIVRCEPDLESMYRAHERGDPSGYIFLADFGESVPSLVSYSNSAQQMAERLLSVRGSTRSKEGVSTHTQGEGESMRSAVTLIHTVEGGPSTVSRSRGTLAIQSPEMLCLTARTDGAVKSLKEVLSRRPSTISPLSPLSPLSHSRADAGSELDSPVFNAVELQALALKRLQEDAKAVTRKAFPPPSAASDVWSLGCLLVELLSGQYLMADRPWTELYVSFCMKKYTPPSLEIMHAAVPLPSIDVCPKLESIASKCLIQDPRQRPKIVDIFEEVMSLIINSAPIEFPLGPVDNPENPGVASGCSNTGTSGIMSNLEPKNVSSVLLGMKTFLHSRQSVSTKTFHIVRWSKETSKLRPRSLDFRCGSGLVITLLPEDTYSTCACPATLMTTLDSSKSTQSMSCTSRSIDNNRLPYRLPSFLLTNFTEDITSGLKARLDGASRLIMNSSLASCAKKLAQQSVLQSARNDGIFHIEISCGNDYNSIYEHPDDLKRDLQEKAIERLVLPVPGGRVGSGTMQCDPLASTPRTDNPEDLFSDSFLAKAIDRVLHLAEVTLSAPIPPAVLITVVPYKGSSLLGETSCTLPSTYYGAGKLETDPSSTAMHGRRGASKRDENDLSRRGEDMDTSSCAYSRVSLTVAVMLADYFAKIVAIKSLEKSNINTAQYPSPLNNRGPSVGASPTTPFHLFLDSPWPRGKNHLKPRSTPESRRNDFKLKKAASIILQSQDQPRIRTSTVSQSLHAVAPWLKKALHPECQVFLLDRLSVPYVM